MEGDRRVTATGCTVQLDNFADADADADAATGGRKQDSKGRGQKSLFS